MTTIPAMLSDLRRRNVNVSVVGDRLRLDAPAGAITPDMRAWASRHKAEIFALLSGGQGTTHVTEITEITQRGGGCPITVISVTPFVDDTNHGAKEETEDFVTYRRRLAEATSEADLQFVVDDAQLKFAGNEMTGPEVEALARQAGILSRGLQDHAPEYDMLPASSLLSPESLPDNCPACRCARWWIDRRSDQRICRVCHPPPSPEFEK
jgi:hypothetical protein